MKLHQDDFLIESTINHSLYFKVRHVYKCGYLPDHNVRAHSHGIKRLAIKSHVVRICDCLAGCFSLFAIKRVITKIWNGKNG